MGSSRLARLLAAAAPALLVACAATPPVPAEAPAAPAAPAIAAPGPATAAAIARAGAAFDELQKRLGERLRAELGSGGPAAAVGVCATEAPAIAAELAQRQGFVFGRTSHRVRNPANAPRPWVAPWLARFAGGPAASAEPAAYDLGDRLGVIRPIGMQPLCLVCHGDPASLDPALKAELARRYPADVATGFKEGELRGAFWAEVPKG